MQIPHPLPHSLQDFIADDTWHVVTEGESTAQVFRLENASNVRYLKITRADARFNVKREKVRLDWLAGRIAVPDVLHYAETDTHHFLVTSAIDGLHPMHDNLEASPEERITILAEAARDFHALPVADCPFSWRMSEQIEVARQAIHRTKLKPHLLEAQWREHTPQSLFDAALKLQPQSEDLVVAHSDMYPVNIRIPPAQKSILGYIDVGRMGIADRYTDLALIANAIRWHFGTEWVERFFHAYGIKRIDTSKLYFYQLMNEFIQHG